MRAYLSIHKLVADVTGWVVHVTVYAHERMGGVLLHMHACMLCVK